MPQEVLYVKCRVAAVTLSNQPFWSMCCRMSSMAVWVSYLSTNGILMSSTKYTRRFDPGGPYFVPATAQRSALQRASFRPAKNKQIYRS